MLQLRDALAAREGFERLLQQTEVGKNLGEDVDQRADRAEKEDDPEPIKIWPPPDEVDEGDEPQQVQCPRCRTATT